MRIRHTHYYADARTDVERLHEPASQLTIFDGRVQLAPCLGIPAPTYSGDLDGERLHTLLVAVHRLMLDRQYRTLGEIRAVVGHSEGGIHARLRQLRRLDAHLKKLPKSAPAVWVVERRRRGDPKQGLWEYRLLK